MIEKTCYQDQTDCPSQSQYPNSSFIDVDRWPQEQIEELHAFCAQKDNWHLVISNPCIEIWLLYHKRADLTDLGIQTAKDAKQALDKIEKGGYYYIKYLPLMLNAIENAQQADTNPDGYMPELLQTKVYHLGRALYERMGKVRFEKSELLTASGQCA